MIRSMFITADGVVQYGDAQLIDQWRQDPTSLLWLELNGVELAAEKALLLDLGCHQLAITDVQRDRHPPKIELFDDYIFMLYRGMLIRRAGMKFEHEQISFFIGRRIFISRKNRQDDDNETMFNARGEKYLQRSPMHLALRMFHYSCGLYLLELFEFEAELESIEGTFQTRGTDKMMRQVTAYRSQLVKLRRAFNYHVNIGETLKAYLDDVDTDIITETDIHTLNDLNERLGRLLTLSQMYYDICGDLINGYMSITSHQLNATMRVLTVITAIFVPLSFLAGIYGMNFEYIPELKSHNGYFILLGFMAMLAIGLIGLFKKKKWL